MIQPTKHDKIVNNLVMSRHFYYPRLTSTVQHFKANLIVYDLFDHVISLLPADHNQISNQQVSHPNLMPRDNLFSKTRFVKDKNRFAE